MKLKLTDYEKNNILKRLPNFELSYDRIINKKVFDKIDYYFIIPKGNRSLLWFSYYKSHNVAIIINLNRYNKYEDVKIYPCCFNDDLVFKETLLYGYEFNIKNNDNIFFAITDIIFYKNNNYQHESYFNKFKVLKNLFINDIKQISFCKENLIIGLPVIYDNYKNIYEELKYNTYDVTGVIYIKNHNSKNYGISYYNINQVLEATFKIKANIQQDIYSLYYKNNNQDIFYDIALINNYTNSVFMNKLFRNIKENSNLDLLEESDTEEEFENIAIDKFVNTNKSINIKCRFNNKFKKWCPYEISKEPIINKKDLFNIINK